MARSQVSTRHKEARGSATEGQRRSRRAKSKGRHLQKVVAARISEYLGAPWGKDEEIASREMGQSGVDIRLTGSAREAMPFSVECKNHSKWNVPRFIREAEDNQEPARPYLLFLMRQDRMKAGRIAPVVVMDMETLFRILEGALPTRATNFERRKPRRRSGI